MTTGRYVTPAGVVVRTTAEVARAVGYAPVKDEKPAAPKRATQTRKTPQQDDEK